MQYTDMLGRESMNAAAVPVLDTWPSMFTVAVELSNMSFAVPHAKNSVTVADEAGSPLTFIKYSGYSQKNNPAQHSTTGFMYVMECKGAIVFTHGCIDSTLADIRLQSSIDLRALQNSVFTSKLSKQNWCVFNVQVDDASAKHIQMVDGFDKNLTTFKGSWFIEYFDLPQLFQLHHDYHSFLFMLQEMYESILEGIYTGNGSLVFNTWQSIKIFQNLYTFPESIHSKSLVASKSTIVFDEHAAINQRMEEATTKDVDEFINNDDKNNIDPCKLFLVDCE